MSGQRDIVAPRIARARIPTVGQQQLAPGEKALTVGQDTIGWWLRGASRSTAIYESGKHRRLHEPFSRRLIAELRREAGHIVAVLLYRIDDGSHETGSRHGIGVDAEHPLAAGLAKSILEGPHLAHPPRRQRFIGDETNARVAL